MNKGKQKEKFPAHITTTDFYNHYAYTYFKYVKEGNKYATTNRNSRFYMTKATYTKILSTFNKKVRDKIINEAFDYSLPYRLGDLGIRKRKLSAYIGEDGEFHNPHPIDWKSTKILWSEDEKAKEEKKLVRFLNKHTQGYVMSWKYSVRRANYKNKSAYDFIPCRTAKRMVTKAILDEDSKIDFYIK